MCVWAHMFVCFVLCMWCVWCYCYSIVIMYNIYYFKGMYECAAVFYIIFCVCFILYCSINYYSIALFETLRMYVDLCHKNTILI